MIAFTQKKLKYLGTAEKAMYSLLKEEAWNTDRINKILEAHFSLSVASTILVMEKKFPRDK